MIGRIIKTWDRYAIAFDLPYPEQQAALKAIGEGAEVVILSKQADGPTEAERGMALDAQELYGQRLYAGKVYTWTGSRFELDERETPFPVICGDEKGYGHGV